MADDGWLGSTERRLSTYLYLQDLMRGLVVELDPVSGGDERSKALLLKCGAERVAGREAGEGTADVVLALEAAADGLDAALAEARRLLKANGVLVISCESRDRPGAQRGVSYFDMQDRVSRVFPQVTMVGVAPFAGTTLVEYGVKDPEPMLDGTLVEKGERVEWYVAVAGPERVSAGGYAVVQVPIAEAFRRRAAVSAPAPAPAKAAPPPRPAPPPPPADADAAELARQREKSLEELREALRKQVEEMEDLRAQLRERDAYNTELEAAARRGYIDAETVRHAEKRAISAEQRERQTRLQLAQAEGKLLLVASQAHQAGPAAAVVESTAAPVVFEGDAGARIAQLEAELQKVRRKEEEARAEMWKHMKARSEAEAQAAEVRDDTVRKLKDARKLASVELMRAMEEATRKAVALREELGRATEERKELEARLRAAEQEIAALRVAAAPPPARDTDELAERQARDRVDGLHGRVQALERELEDAERRAEGEEQRAAQLAELVRQLEARVAEARHESATGTATHGAELDAAQAEHERLQRTLSEVEAQAAKRADAAIQIKKAMREREREVEALRHELTDRDARIVALERQHPPADEVARMEVELAQSRIQMADLKLEMSRRETTAERAAQAAAHERARAERLFAEERRAVAERNDARARTAEVEAQVSALAVELERARRERELEAERARHAESEARERKDRNKRLKRDLEDAERRASRVEVVRERLSGLESALRAEEERLGQMEAALDRAAQGI
jgi:chromosome segregation ATPase